MPKIDEVKPLPAEKVCMICNSDNSATAVFCVNCGADISRVKASLKERKRDNVGPQKQQVAHESIVQGIPVVKVHVPSANVAVAQNKNDMQKPIKPIERPISDDAVDVVDEEHLKQVEESADLCGL